MSARIEEIFEVVENVRTEYFYNKAASIRQLRINATKKISTKRNIYESTVSNKYRRELKPEINGTDEFDFALSEWLKNGSNKLKNALFNHCVNSYDKQRIMNLFDSTIIENTPVAIDITESTAPDRTLQETYRILRDTSLAREIKAANLNRCQICGETLSLKNGKPYSEAHHIKPLGRPHNGLDIKENIICVCPNHHVLLDYGAIELNHSELKDINIEFINYHNKIICSKTIA